MKLKDAIWYMSAEKLVLKENTSCDHCKKQTKTVYQLICPKHYFDDAHLCGKCLIKVAVSWKEHCDEGGV